jgi:glycosyltransferase involved in cell wall biosynthesis
MPGSDSVSKSGFRTPLVRHYLAAVVNRLLDDPQRCRQMGLRSRERFERTFSWASIARRTCEFYKSL